MKRNRVIAITAGVAILGAAGIALYTYFVLVSAYDFRIEIPDGPYEEMTLGEVQADSELIQVDARVHWILAPNAILISDKDIGPYIVILVAEARESIDTTPLEAGAKVRIHGEVMGLANKKEDESVILGVTDSTWDDIEGTPLIQAYRMERLDSLGTESD